jgi:hypothetical protein
MTKTRALLRTYLAQKGLFARVARKLKLHPSYVSRVARGKRRNKRVSSALNSELNKSLPVSRMKPKHR